MAIEFSSVKCCFKNGFPAMSNFICVTRLIQYFSSIQLLNRENISGSSFVCNSVSMDFMPLPVIGNLFRLSGGSLHGI